MWTVSSVVTFDVSFDIILQKGNKPSLCYKIMDSKPRTTAHMITPLASARAIHHCLRKDFKKQFNISKNMIHFLPES